MAHLGRTSRPLQSSMRDERASAAIRAEAEPSSPAATQIPSLHDRYRRARPSPIQERPNRPWCARQVQACTASAMHMKVNAQSVLVQARAGARCACRGLVALTCMLIVEPSAFEVLVEPHSRRACLQQPATCSVPPLRNQQLAARAARQARPASCRTGRRTAQQAAGKPPDRPLNGG